MIVRRRTKQHKLPHKKNAARLFEAYRDLVWRRRQYRGVSRTQSRGPIRLRDYLLHLQRVHRMRDKDIVRMLTHGRGSGSLRWIPSECALIRSTSSSPPSVASSSSSSSSSSSTSSSSSVSLDHRPPLPSTTNTIVRQRTLPPPPSSPRPIPPMPVSIRVTDPTPVVPVRPVSTFGSPLHGGGRSSFPDTLRNKAKSRALARFRARPEEGGDRVSVFAKGF